MPHINKERFRELFFASPMLVLTAAVMALDLVVCVLGLLFDHTVITGAPVWVKPTKFAVSTGLYALSLVVIIRYTPIWKRTLRTIEFLIGLALMVEILLIDLQAARHTTSHFNVATPFDRNVFITMAVGIGILWLSSLVLTVATFRTRYGSPSWTLAVRYGMLLAVLGAGTGAFMAAPSRAQRQAARSTHHMTLSGSHTIGGVDGGPGLSVLGWSTQHGDVRVAHFTGLHGLQVLALLVFYLQRRRLPPGKAARMVSVAVLSYGSLFLITLAEALLQKPITEHGAVAMMVWTLWAALSLALVRNVTRNRHAIVSDFSLHPKG